MRYLRAQRLGGRGISKPSGTNESGAAEGNRETERVGQATSTTSLRGGREPLGWFEA